MVDDGRTRWTPGDMAGYTNRTLLARVEALEKRVVELEEARRPYISNEPYFRMPDPPPVATTRVANANDQV